MLWMILAVLTAAFTAASSILFLLVLAAVRADILMKGLLPDQSRDGDTLDLQTCQAEIQLSSAMDLNNQDANSQTGSWKLTIPHDAA